MRITVQAKYGRHVGWGGGGANDMVLVNRSIKKNKNIDLQPLGVDIIEGTHFGMGGGGTFHNVQ